MELRGAALLAMTVSQRGKFTVPNLPDVALNGSPDRLLVGRGKCVGVLEHFDQRVRFLGHVAARVLVVRVQIDKYEREDERKEGQCNRGDGRDDLAGRLVSPGREPGSPDQDQATKPKRYRSADEQQDESPVRQRI